MYTLERIAVIVGGILHATTSADRHRSPARVCHDSRQIEAGDLFVALPGARTDGRLFVDAAFASGACAAMLAPGTGGHGFERGGPWIEVADPVRALAVLAAAWRDELDATVIAVSGTNGKTTTKELLAHILSGIGPTHASPGNLNTEIGVPLSVLATPRHARFCVFEAGADRPGDLAPLSRLLRPNLVVLTGVGRGHLDRFATVRAVAEEKWQLVQTRPAGAAALVNGDDEDLRARADRSADPNVWTFGVRRRDCDLSGEVLGHAPTLTVRIGECDALVRCPLLGRHNATNVLAAVAAAKRLDIPWSLIIRRTATFRPPAHRLILHSGLPWGRLLDDSYNANPDSTLAALDVLESLTSHPSERAVLFGEMHGLGQFSDEGHRTVAARIASLGVSAVFPYGKAAVDAVSARSDLLCVPVGQDSHRLVVAVRAHMTHHPGVLLIKGSRALGLDGLADTLAADVRPIPGATEKHD